MQRTLITLIFFLFTAISFAQGETSNWYFGQNVGIRFNADGSVTALTDSQMQTFEGCTSISDSDGNLLFYTDGLTVWNGAHSVIENGLLGNSSSSQSAIVVPQPGSTEIYYIFTVDAQFQGDPDSGFNYSIVDFADPNGRITTKNVNLLQDSSEKITAVLRDCISGSIWVITLANSSGSGEPFDTFFAYEITTSGINTTPVTSTFQELSTITDERGYMKASPDGSKLAIANMSNGLFLFDFDINTGVVSNANQLAINSINNSAYGVEFSPNNNLLYVHSSNGATGGNPLNHSSSLIQYDLQSQDISGSQVLIDDRTLYRGALQLGSNGKIYRALSNSYGSGTSFLGVINDPNVKGLGCNYVHNAVNLGTGISTQGLPPFIQSYFNKIDLVIDDGSAMANNIITACQENTISITATNIPGANYVWTFDGNPIATPTPPHQLVLNNVQVAQAGLYEVEIDPQNGDCPQVGEARITINPLPILNSGQSLEQCDSDNNNIADFNLFQSYNLVTDGAPGYILTFYDIDPVANPSATAIDSNLATEYPNTSAGDETIYVKVETPEGCFDYTSFTIRVSSTNLGNISPMNSCEDTDNVIDNAEALFDLDAKRTEIRTLFGLPVTTSLRFYASRKDADKEEDAMMQSLEIDDNYITKSTTIWVRAEGALQQCFGIEPIQLTVDPLPLLTLAPSNTVICKNPETGAILSDVTLGQDLGANYTYSWVDASQNQLATTALYTPSAAGTYSVIITNTTTGCSAQSNAVTINESSPAVDIRPTYLTIEQTPAFSGMHTVTIEAKGIGIASYEYSLNGGPFRSDGIFTDVPAGKHEITIINVQGCDSLTITINIIGYPRFFTPNNDGDNDTWNIIDENNEIFGRIYIFDRYGKLLKVFDPRTASWDGTFNGQPLPSSDYWFRIVYIDPIDQKEKQFSRHFTLKR